MLMRLIIELLAQAEDSTMSRAQIEDALVPLGFRSDNILRALRSLERFRVLRMKEGRFPETSFVGLFQPVEKPIPNEEVFAILDSLGRR